MAQPALEIEAARVAGLALADPDAPAQRQLEGERATGPQKRVRIARCEDGD